VIEFKVQREEFSGLSTVGRLFFRVPGGTWTWLCYTLEDPVREVPGQPVTNWKVPGQTAIPRGTYGLTVTRSVRFSAKAGHDVFLPLLADVPGFSGVRIHGGNTAADTEGCILAAHSHPHRDMIQGNATSDIKALIAEFGGVGTITIEGEKP
jgi:hypothetical protein